MLQKENISSVLGMALYTGKINYEELVEFLAKGIKHKVIERGE